MPLTEPAGVYRPRHPERTVVYRLFEDHFERYVREYEERYEAREGSLRKVVPTTVEAYLACGRLEGGFARIRCPNCRAEHLLAFSCRTRNFCPSCQAKRSALFAEHVVTEILEPVPHRHVVVTIPRVLRGLFQRERRLLGLLARAARDAIVLSVRAILDRHDATPGLVVSIQTFGSYAANFHPHGHALATDGAFTKAGEFLQLPYFDARLVEGGILPTTVAPSPGASQSATENAKRHIGAILKSLNFVGVLAVEFLDAGSELLANEMAPCVHNTGHWTIEGARTSQFENRMRAVGHYRMVNFIGTEPESSRVLATGAKLHLYARRPGRGGSWVMRRWWRNMQQTRPA